MRVSLLLSCLGAAAGCTTVLVGKKASADGSTFSSHTNDAFDPKKDPRLVRVPARAHAAGATRPIYLTLEDYPRYSTYERELPAYYPVGNQSASAPIGEIPEVRKTHAYYEGTYGALNEKQVGLGESTCSCVSWTALDPKSKPSPPCTSESEAGDACSLLSVDELSSIAMERASSAREAVRLMGELAVAHGFYGCDSEEGSGESLMVNDPNDGWIFHVLPRATRGCFDIMPFTR